MGKILAIDIGGTFIKYGIVEPDNDISVKYKIRTPEVDTKEKFYDYLCENICELEGVDGIGISVPGLVDSDGNIRSYAAPRLNVLFGTNITREIRERRLLPAAAINDAKAAGLCELKLGTARGTKLSAFLIIGTGGGGCICLEDDVFWGTDNFAGEFHFMAYFNEKNGDTMKVGRTTGMFGLINRYNESVDKNHQVSLGEEIIRRYFDGEETAVRIVEEWIHRIALQCLSIAVVVNPEVLCIGGGISEEAWFIERLKREYRKVEGEHFEGEHFLSTHLETCMYRNDSNLLGAALYVRRKMKEVIY